MANDTASVPTALDERERRRSPRFDRSTAHTVAAEHVIPGGAHTYARGADQFPEGMAPIIERGFGCRVRDIDGNELIEFGSGLRSVTLGHGRPEVVEAVTRHIGGGVSFVRPHRIELEAAERLVDLIPAAEMVKFGLSGSDATTAGVKLARAHTGRDMVAVCRQHPFLSTDDWFITTTPMSAGITDSTHARTVAFDYNDAASLEALFAEHPGRIAVVVMEAETIEPPRPGFFTAVRRLCDSEGALLMLDEIITGFRWHERGAQYLYDIEPDLCTFGKGIANGLPLSALAGRREIMRLGGFVEDADRVFLLSQTTAAEPWALAAMLAVIDVYERDAVAEQLHQIGATLRARIDDVVQSAGLAEHIVLRGRDCNVVFHTLGADGTPSQDLRTVMLRGLLDNGVLAPSFVVSAAHDDDALDLTVEAVARMLPDYRRALEGDPDASSRGRAVRPALRRRG